jgi:hypothetical protein
MTRRLRSTPISEVQTPTPGNPRQGRVRDVTAVRRPGKGLSAQCQRATTAGDRLLAAPGRDRRGPPGMEVRREVSRERVVPAPLDRSSTAQMLVVGRRSRGRLAALTLGSTSDSLVRQSACLPGGRGARQAVGVEARAGRGLESDVNLVLEAGRQLPFVVQGRLRAAARRARAGASLVSRLSGRATTGAAALRNPQGPIDLSRDSRPDRWAGSFGHSGRRPLA